jgi:hypothetical protein
MKVKGSGRENVMLHFSYNLIITTIGFLIRSTVHCTSKFIKFFVEDRFSFLLLVSLSCEIFQ